MADVVKRLSLRGVLELVIANGNTSPSTITKARTLMALEWDLNEWFLHVAKRTLDDSQLLHVLEQSERALFSVEEAWAKAQSTGSFTELELAIDAAIVTTRECRNVGAI